MNLGNVVMANKGQLAKIHIAKAELGLTQEDYLSILSGFGVESSKDLDNSKADELIKHLKKLGWQPKIKKKKWLEGADNRVLMAWRIWSGISYASNKAAAFCSFCKKFGAKTPEKLKGNQASKVLEAVKAMSKRA